MVRRGAGPEAPAGRHGSGGPTNFRLHFVPEGGFFQIEGAGWGVLPQLVQIMDLPASVRACSPAQLNVEAGVVLEAGPITLDLDRRRRAPDEDGPETIDTLSQLRLDGLPLAGR